MALTAYSKYRLLITRTSGSDAGAPGYTSVNDFDLWTTADHSDTRLGATAGATFSASGQYGSQAPGLAFDGNAATYWESNNTAAASRWVRIDLPSAVVVRSFYLNSAAYANEIPRDFKLQGSNDGTTWVDLFAVVDWVTTASYRPGQYFAINLTVSGTSVLDTGVGAVRVLIHIWATGELIASVTPDPFTGAWSYRATDQADVLVTHIGPSGYRPVSDGPITPYAE